MLKPQRISFANKSKQAFSSLVVFLGVVIAAFAIYGFYDRVWIRATLTADPLYVARDAIAITVLLLPVIIALKWSKQTFADVGLTKKNLGKNLALGTLTSIVLLSFIGVFSPSLGGGFAGFSNASAFSLLSYVIIGVGEEIIFRGYIQSRVVDRFGSVMGIGASSVMYAVYNFPLGFFCFSGNVMLAAVYAAWRLSSGILYGCTYHKGQSVVSSAIVHIFLVWGALLFSLYL